MSWTDERVDILGRLWLEGRSASQIANALGEGLTRNAVIGKIHRLGLASRVKTLAGAPEAEAVDVGAEAEALEAARPLLRAAGGGGASVVAAVDARVDPRGGSRVGPGAALAVVEPQKPRAAADVVVPMSPKVTIVELRESMCRWPIGDPASVDFRYCGSPSHSGTPYCQHHGKLAYQPTQDRRRERERRPLLAR